MKQNQNEYEIRMEGQPLQYEGGGIRYDKSNKIGFHLIPKEILMKFMLFEPIDLESFKYADENELKLKAAFCMLQERFFDAIYYMMMAEKLTKPQVITELATHYTEGAKRYGVDNWKKGLPAESFKESGLRHFFMWWNNQKFVPLRDIPENFDENYSEYFYIKKYKMDGIKDKYDGEVSRLTKDDLDDLSNIIIYYRDYENHFAATIWNIFGWLWYTDTDKE